MDRAILGNHLLGLKSNYETDIYGLELRLKIPGDNEEVLCSSAGNVFNMHKIK